MDKKTEKPSVTIKLFKDGPYLVEGKVNIVGLDGTVKEYEDPHLCRCGGSSNKPFCDGSHNKIGFKG